MLTAFATGTMSFCSGITSIGNSRAPSCTIVGILVITRSLQSVGARLFPFDPDGVDVIVVKLFEKLVLMSWSDHRVVVEVVRASDCLFNWVFIVYPDIAVSGFLGDSGISEIGLIEEILVCTYRSSRKSS